MLRVTMTVVVVLMLSTAPAQAKSFTVRQLSDARVGSAKAELLAQRQHSEQVISFFTEGHRWLIAPRHSQCWSIRGSRYRRLCDRARKQLFAHRWLYKMASDRLERMYPASDPASVRVWTERNHPCLAGIIAGENRGYDPTLDYGGGHGDTSEAYGIPQANPGTKMASAGADWRTNPWTQLRWMMSYVQQYGGECAALDHKRRVGTY